MAKVDLKALGFEQVYVSFNGSSVLLKEGQDFGESEIVSMYPKYFGGAIVEVKAPKVEKIEVKEEILTEDSSSVEVTSEEVVQEIIEQAVEEIVQVKEASSKKK